MERQQSCLWRGRCPESQESGEQTVLPRERQESGEARVLAPTANSPRPDLPRVQRHFLGRHPRPCCVRLLLHPPLLARRHLATSARRRRRHLVQHPDTLVQHRDTLGALASSSPFLPRRRRTASKTPPRSTHIMSARRNGPSQPRWADVLKTCLGSCLESCPYVSCRL